MTPDKNLLELHQREAVADRRFDPRSANPFVNKSVSEETRCAYCKAVADFFQFIGGKHPTEVVPSDVLSWQEAPGYCLIQAFRDSFLLRVSEGRRSHPAQPSLDKTCTPA